MKTAALIILIHICYLTTNGQLRITEVQSSNLSTLADDAGEYDDWIEIKNIGSEVMDAAGLVLKDNVDTWPIPTGLTETVLFPGEMLLIWADDQEFQGDFHTNFKLSAANGENLSLYESDGETLIQSIDIPPLDENASFILCDDWLVSNNPTPLAENDCSTGIQNFDSCMWSVPDNLIKDRLYIQTSACTPLTIVVWDSLGRSMDAVLDDSSINASTWPAGFYFIQDQVSGKVIRVFKE